MWVIFVYIVLRGERTGEALAPPPPPPHTHTHTHVCSVVRSEAAATIGRWWLGVRNKRVFKILKEAICAAVRRFLISVCTSITSQKITILMRYERPLPREVAGE